MTTSDSMVDSAAGNPVDHAASSPVDVAPAHIRALPRHTPTLAEPAVPVQPRFTLASNENPLGASPKALAAMAAQLADPCGVALYPDPAGLALKAALCERHGLVLSQIVLGNGSSELIDLVARSFLRAGDEAVFSQYCFISYPVAVQATGATGVRVPALAFGHDLAAMAGAINHRTRLVFIANPNNPTGTLLTEAQLRAFLAGVPCHVLVVLDEAYNEYLAPALRWDAFALLQAHPNLVVLRTFSKAYGLAGLRVGYAAAGVAVADLLNRARPVFNVNALAQCAAVAALGDDDFLARTFDTTRQGMAQLTAAFHQLGLPYVPSHGNFVAVDFAQAARPAAEVQQRLQALGFVVRSLVPYGLPGHLRVTVGRVEENAGLLAALEAAVQLKA